MDETFKCTEEDGSENSSYRPRPNIQKTPKNPLLYNIAFYLDTVLSKIISKSLQKWTNNVSELYGIPILYILHTEAN